MFRGAFNKFRTALPTNIQPKSNLNKNFQQQFRKASTTSAPIALTDIETNWKTLPVEEQVNLTKQLEELQKQDWNKLSLEEKKASYYIAFGSHGPREPFLKAGHGSKVTIGVGIIILISSGLFYLSRVAVRDKPSTINKEWEEATTEKLIKQKADPISGIASEGYKGKGFVVSSN